jgi:hypothetical protein
MKDGTKELLSFAGNIQFEEDLLLRAIAKRGIYESLIFRNVKISPVQAVQLTGLNGNTMDLTFFVKWIRPGIKLYWVFVEYKLYLQ